MASGGAAPRRRDRRCERAQITAASRAGDDYLQDYWGPVRHAFNETFKGEYKRSFKMVDPALTANCAADFDALKQSGALAEDFHDRALPLGCMVPDDIQDKIEEDGIDLSDVVVVGAARAGVGIDMYDYLFSGLFWLNFLLLLFYGGLFATAWFLGQFHEDESSELSHFKKAEKRVQEGIVRLETVFELHGADSLDVQTFFHKWKETSDKLRSREDTINRRRAMRTPQHDERRVGDTSWRSPKHSPVGPVGSVVAVVGSGDLPRPPSVQKPRFIFDPTRVTWYWEETPERISQHPVVRPPYWVPFDEKAASTLEQALVDERSLVQLSGGKYVADLRTMTQKNQQTSYSRRILREASS